MNTLRKKDFIENCQFPDLAKKVLRQLAPSWWEVIERPEDFGNASAGVSGFIYYSETEKFAKKNIELILEMYENYQEETGAILKDLSLNTLAWFALESVIYEIVKFKEDQEEC
jgi:Glu-tRNA(Gln) amidotransferase subunit E-like FAD-binding protein